MPYNPPCQQVISGQLWRYSADDNHPHAALILLSFQTERDSSLSYSVVVIFIILTVGLLVGAMVKDTMQARISPSHFLARWNVSGLSRTPSTPHGAKTEALRLYASCSNSPNEDPQTALIMASDADRAY